eukprot:CAMPEP_0119561328 /NCGR_PEP_ID=MMETSP1352-20130426/17272_1 /TAXON_ID=265584 /ORGANISM="Stauroneis constricta, Strain CCMP1120" /LENGTH=484 /DNA_ID=CAMNT_0007609505 /DNA_START=93 /DNA_END=1547 /DNA_ORIENTATION=-
MDLGIEDRQDELEWKKYSYYSVDVDFTQDDKAKEIELCSFGRPHMRAFHCSWWSFFIAFFIWFAISPLLSEISEDLGLTKQEIWTSSIAGVGGTIAVRFVVGPLCDKFGARVLFAVMLCGASIPTAMTGLINSASGLIILRGFIGLAGGTFVTCQYWTSRMFTKEVVGTANALVGGWGNLGASVTQIVMGSFLFPVFKTAFDNDAEMAWRTVSIVPAVIAFATGVIVYKISDDSPKGNYSELRVHGNMKEVSTWQSFWVACADFNTWLLFIQYACCFGVELTMNNAAALYFRDVFGQSTESAGAIASIFGWMNLFARGAGGVLSDSLNESMGMRGRLLAQFVLLLGEGIAVLIFATTDTLAGAVVVLVLFSLFVQAAEGSSYGIVPYVNPPYMGSVTGIVGAGGNVGAVVFGLCFRELNYRKAFTIMGSCVLASSVLSAFIFIKGYSNIRTKEEMEVDKETGDVLGPKPKLQVNTTSKKLNGVV